MSYRYFKNPDGTINGFVSTDDPCDMVDVFPVPPEKMFWGEGRRAEFRRQRIKRALSDAIPDIVYDEREHGAMAVINALIQRAKDLDSTITLDTVPKERKHDQGEV